MTLEFFTLYHNARDYPGLYVVRRSETGGGVPGVRHDPEPLFVGPERPGADVLPRAGLTWIQRFPDDELQIVGVWF